MPLLNFTCLVTLRQAMTLKGSRRTSTQGKHCQLGKLLSRRPRSKTHRAQTMESWKRPQAGWVQRSPNWWWRSLLGTGAAPPVTLSQEGRGARPQTVLRGSFLGKKNGHPGNMAILNLSPPRTVIHNNRANWNGHHTPKEASSRAQPICQCRRLKRNHRTSQGRRWRRVSADQTQESGNGFYFFRCACKMKHWEN